uniref:Uncharacterized protein n=1 Tax=Glossina pallidipes TaxID=7398 RepID=A0A1A9ZKV2_GLOPL
MTESIHMREYEQTDSGNANNHLMLQETISCEKNFVESEIQQTVYNDEAKRDQLLVKPLKEHADGDELHYARHCRVPIALDYIHKLKANTYPKKLTRKQKMDSKIDERISREMGTPGKNGFISQEMNTSIKNGLISQAMCTSVKNGFIGQKKEPPIKNGFISQKMDTPVKNGLISQKTDSQSKKGTIVDSHNKFTNDKVPKNIYTIISDLYFLGSITSCIVFYDLDDVGYFMHH